MIWRIQGRHYDLSRRGWIMGIVNVTPDSFSDGGLFLDIPAACEQGQRLIEQGADVLDIGGESTRPGASSVPAEEELKRVLPVIRCLRDQSDVLISIDTSKAVVARAALDAGADIVNDVTGLRGDREMASVVLNSGAGVIIMHMQGNPRTMQIAPQYQNVVVEVGNFFRQAIEGAVVSGIDLMNIALDPGLGFGKTFQHNQDLLKNLSAFDVFNRPIVVGFSRKSFLGAIAGSQNMAERFWPGISLTSFCRERGARVLRVHEVKPHVEALRMTEAILDNA